MYAGDTIELTEKAKGLAVVLEATQLAGFTVEESLQIFGTPPAGYDLVIHPQPPAEAQQRYVARFHTLSEAAGYERTPQAFSTE